MKLSEEWRKAEFPQPVSPSTAMLIGGIISIGDRMADELDRLEKLTGLYRQLVDRFGLRDIHQADAFTEYDQIKQMEAER